MPRRQIYTDDKIKILQANLSSIRNIANWTAEELGDKIGVSKQTISNLENSDGKSNLMNPTQYIAIRAIIDDEIDSAPNAILRDAMGYLFNENHDHLFDGDFEKIKDEKVTQLGAATKAAIASQPKKNRDSDLAKSIAISAIVPLVAGILGFVLSSKPNYKTNEFIKDMLRKK